MQPEITIITVTLNSVKTVERTIKSVLAQKYDKLEYIIVDGGSTDGTLDVIRRYEPYLAKWVSEPDDGISSAFNKGIRMATGDLIGIINSDDGLVPGALAALAAAYEPEVDVYRGDLQIWKEDTDTMTIEKPSLHIRYNGLNHIDHPSTFIARRAYEQYGLYDEKCRFVMDFDLLLRYQQAGAKIKYVDKALAFFTLGGVTFTEFDRAKRQEFRYMLRKNGANAFEVWSFFAVKYAKMGIIRVFGKENIMRLTAK